MSLAIVFMVYSVATALVACILFRRYKREPERRLFFISMFAVWLAVPIVVWFAPTSWIPTSKRGHPSWLSVAVLVLLVGAIILESWRQPARRRLYAVVWIPLITALVLLQIVYPLLWQR